MESCAVLMTGQSHTRAYTCALCCLSILGQPAHRASKPDQELAPFRGKDCFRKVPCPQHYFYSGEMGCRTCCWKLVLCVCLKKDLSFDVWMSSQVLFQSTSHDNKGADRAGSQWMHAGDGTNWGGRRRSHCRSPQEFASRRFAADSRSIYWRPSIAKRLTKRSAKLAATLSWSSPSVNVVWVWDFSKADPCIKNPPAHDEQVQCSGPKS